MSAEEQKSSTVSDFNIDISENAVEEHPKAFLLRHCEFVATLRRWRQLIQTLIVQSAVANRVLPPNRQERGVSNSAKLTTMMWR